MPATKRPIARSASLHHLGMGLQFHATPFSIRVDLCIELLSWPCAVQRDAERAVMQNVS